jgi:hypothetical protein
MSRLCLWTALDGWRVEVASVDLWSHGLRAVGTQLGVDPVPYRLGNWRSESAEEGDVDLPQVGGDAEALSGARDCDLAFSPLTNTMPIRRHALHVRPGAVDYLMAWVSVPDLGLHASRQRYEHVRRQAEEAVVRYVDIGADRGFTSELVLDEDGLVLVYPHLARRLERPEDAETH